MSTRKQAPRLARPAVRYWKGKAPKGVDVDVDSDSDQEEVQEVAEDGDVDIGGDQDIVSEDDEGDGKPVPMVQKPANKAMNVVLRDVEISKDGKVIVAGREESGRTAMEDEDDDSDEDEEEAESKPRIPGAPKAESDESSEYESDSEEEKPKVQFRPVFVPKRARITVAEREAEDSEEAQRRREAEAEERRKQSHDLVAESIRRELAEKEKEDNIPDIDDTDGLDPEAEFEAWRLRELGRIKKEKEEELRREEEREEIERRRALPEEQRLKEDLERAQKLRDEKPKGSQKIPSKILAQGILSNSFQDEEILHKRDYTEATESTVDVSLLPAVMQVKNFGKRSRTKYTHLLDQDTTMATGGFGGTAPVKAGGKSLEGGGCFLCGGPHLKKDCPQNTGEIGVTLAHGENVMVVVGAARGKSAIATASWILVTEEKTGMAGFSSILTVTVALAVALTTDSKRALEMMIGVGEKDGGALLSGRGHDLQTATTEKSGDVYIRIGRWGLPRVCLVYLSAARAFKLEVRSDNPTPHSTWIVKPNTSFTGQIRMQIFMRNISFAANVEDLQAALAQEIHRPPLNVPPDPPINFHVQIFRHRSRRVKNHRGIGILTLPTREIGEQFLALFGESIDIWSLRSRTGGISVKGRTVQFTASRGEVDHGLVEAVRSTSWIDPKSLREEREERVRLSGPIALASFSFGRFCRDGVFSPEASYLGIIACNVESRRIEITHKGRLEPQLPSTATPPSFDFAALRDELPNSGETSHDDGGSFRLNFERLFGPEIMENLFSTSVTVSVNYSANRVIAVATDPNSKTSEYQVFLQSNLPPLFQRLAFSPLADQEPVPERISSFSDEDFRVSSRTSQGLRLVFKTHLDMDTFLARCRSLPSMPDPLNRDVLVVERNIYSEQNLAAMQKSLGSIEDFGLAFEVEKAVWEGLLEPLEVVSMRESLLDLQRRTQGLETAAIFRMKIVLPPRRDSKLSINQLLDERYKKPLNVGLHVAGRSYEFLGYSMSGLKAYSFTFVTPFMYGGDMLNAQRIRESLGNFSKILYRPALLAARWSQAFSASDPSVTLETDQILQQPDLCSVSGSVFTDGCSSISVALARQVWKALRASQRIPRPPSALQFRCGGAKGVLVQNPNLSEKTLFFRPSQTKFEAADLRTLDIAATSSRPILTYLNRPLIALLEYHGTPPEAFMALQKSAIDEGQSIKDSLLQASKLFSQHGLGASFRLPSLFNNLYYQLKFEIGDWSNPNVFQHLLIKTALALATTHILREIKHRAHIIIPGSYTLIGVSDEWGCLEEGEVYATVVDDRVGLNEAIIGRILITRSPQIHPGDVQFVTAVRKPQLAHLQNVVVFSCKGSRSLPSQLGGGDLDGDIYNLILDETLYPPKEFTAAPGEYVALAPKETPGPCQLSDVADFVIDFIKSDLLGYISILHLRIGDLDPEGPGCENCVKLAEHASHAVDFNKRGVPVNFMDLPKPPSPLKPDYLSGEGVNPASLMADVYYPSVKVLGTLYRSVPDEDYHPDPAELEQQPTDGDKIQAALASVGLRSLGLPTLDVLPDEDLMEEMRNILDEYSDQLLIIAKTHTISKRANAHLSEAELVSGTIQERYSDHRKRREAVSAMNLQTGELTKAIRHEFQSFDYRGIQYTEEEDQDEESDSEEENIAEDEERRRDKFERAWAAWLVAEEALDDDPTSYGPSSFGLIALGTLLEVVKEAKHRL
ncbi:RdRP-domain-containing protein [Mycena sanguinolenta]|uniref:RdRP-domain-containing protein n=1 Tax=Mycena sanguinolenta TaxID=230812 RepID=A0A8H6YYP0_9AGAR|nr:RdRP-domain-containing protein [Mycena sanguinolenta]